MQDDYVEYVSARVPALRKLAFTLTGDGHRADDLVQQTITTLYVKWSRARKAENLDGYVRTMLVRSFVDERRLAWAKVRLFREAPEPPPFEPDGAVEDREVLRAALKRVPRRQRAVLVLRFFYDLPVEEVATILGCTGGTVKSNTSRGLATLRTLLDERSLVGRSTTK